MTVPVSRNGNNGTAFFTLPSIIDVTTEKALNFIMPLKSVAKLCFDEENEYLMSAEKLKQ